MGERGRRRESAPGHLPLCSPRKTNLNFLSGFPKSPPVVMMRLARQRAAPGGKRGQGGEKQRLQTGSFAQGDPSAPLPSPPAEGGSDLGVLTGEPPEPGT